MRLYTFPKWLRWLYPGAIWDFSFKKEKTIYLTFDDGPNPEITEYILDLLERYNAEATFFCIGGNVVDHPVLFDKIKDAGHAVGNHSMTHPNGWWTRNSRYYNDIAQADELIGSKLFRPPYGRIGLNQFRVLKKKGYQIVFWSVVSYDFDPALRAKNLIKKMKRLTFPGAVFVFHDNPKALSVLKNELPRLMEYWKTNNYTFKKLHSELKKDA